MRKIKLSKGKQALVDDEDYEYLNQWKWSYDDGYAHRTEHGPKNVWQRKIRMHRLLLKANKGEYIDHIDHNGVNNQKTNLRKCTHQQNSCNQQLSAANTSGYKGVYSFMKRKKHLRWRARIGVNRKRIWLGDFKEKEDAIAAYRKAVKIYHKEFACYG